MKRTKRTITIIIIMAMAVSLFSGCSCNKRTDTSTPDEAANSQVHTVEETTATQIDTDIENAVKEAGLKVDEDGNITDKKGNKVEIKEDGKVEVKTSNGKTIIVDTTSIKTVNNNAASTSSASSSTDKQQNNSSTNQNSNNTSNSNASSSSSSTSQSSNKNPNEGKTYHEAVYKTVEHPAEYKDVWVVDVAAHTETEPVYEWKDETICYNCGSIITGNTNTHMKNHALNGEMKGYGVEQVQVQTGTKTVNVPEQGHYEKQLIKEAWTEKVLVKEAGWY